MRGNKITSSNRLEIINLQKTNGVLKWDMPIIDIIYFYDMSLSV